MMPATSKKGKRNTGEARGVEVRGAAVPAAAGVLTPEALAFVARLHREFNSVRERLLDSRRARQTELDRGVAPAFLPSTADVRAGDWSVAAAPADLDDRRVEITGPVERKMMINALNSGARVFMADFEDSLSPTWANVVEGQANLQEAVRRTLSFTSPEGKAYRLQERLATLVVRPRGWHLTDRHLLVDGQPVSASLLDFGLYMFHNAAELVTRGSGPYFYLPKLESHLEARLWNDAFLLAQELLDLPRGTIRATVLIETILAAFEMDEILFELREHASGLNAGRWDYLFSAIKKFRARRDLALPDRAQLTMTVPFMRAYTELLVRTCHRRGAHAIGGMAAFVPSRKDPAVNQTAFARVTEDKEREAGDGFDGTWVAHPDLVPVAQAVFDRVLGSRPHQKDRNREPAPADGSRLIDLVVPNGTITEAGVRNNVSVALQYIESWLRGVGAAAIYNLMEDAATAEISRSQLWQWRTAGATLTDGRRFTAALYHTMRDEELARLGGAETGRYRDAAAILDALVLADEMDEFLTLKAYEKLA
jgi:malate synthase